MEKPFVLVVDDNDATCALVTALLHKDFTVETAHDGHAAVEKLRNRRYAAVLLDLVMPHADGYVVLDFLRDERPDVLPKTIVITAAVQRREGERAATYGVCDVLSKPFEVDVLLDRVRRCAGDDDPADGFGPMLSSGMILMLAGLLRQV